MIDKIVATVEDAVAGVEDGATVMIGGFGRAGQPVELIDALIAGASTCSSTPSRPISRSSRG